MKNIPSLVAFTLLFLVASARAEFANGQAADLVLGQPDFVTSTTGLSSTKMNFPRGVAIDAATGKVFVSDTVNNRVLRFASSASLASGAAAEAVLGQADFVSGGATTTQNGMSSNTGICIDAAGRLWVADRGNHRVLRFENAATKVSGSPADGVLGQVLFTTAVAAAGTTGMSGPAGVTTDAAGTLWVIDRDNNRVLRFNNAALKANGAAADGVLGQPDFATVTSGTFANKMAGPFDAVVSPSGTLWVSDQSNNRVLRFDNAAAKADGANADGVLGQTLFTTNTTGTNAASFNLTLGVDLDSAGTLYVVDFFNNRAVFFKNAAAKGNGSNADGVLGQPDFATNTGVTTAAGMNGPQGLAVDAAGRVYISQTTSHRVTRYSPIDGTPKLTVIGKVKRNTHLAKPTIKGTASSALGILKVQYRVGNKGAYKKASGTTTWSFKPKLKFGSNRISIIAVAIDGSVKTQLIRVTRLP